MLKEERYDKILEILDEETYVDNHTLSEKLYVSMPTIRRDLCYLASKNLIVRSHGGAKKVSADRIVAPLNYRKTLNTTEKKRIAKKAAELVKDGDIIFIDASTTALHLGEFLGEKKGITVVTNGIPLSVILAEKGIKTYSVGGEIQKSSLAYAGVLARSFVENFNFDVCFFSCHALGNDGKIMDTSLEENIIRMTAIKKSKKSVFLCDSSKIGLSAPYNLIDADDIDYIITE